MRVAFDQITEEIRAACEEVQSWLERDKDICADGKGLNGLAVFDWGGGRSMKSINQWLKC
jgi:hypothetical protein